MNPEQPEIGDFERDVIEAAIAHKKLRDQYAAYTFEDKAFDGAVDALIAARQAFAAECEKKINKAFDSIPGLERVL